MDSTTASSTSPPGLVSTQDTRAVPDVTLPMRRLEPLAWVFQLSLVTYEVLQSAIVRGLVHGDTLLVSTLGIVSLFQLAQTWRISATLSSRIRGLKPYL